MKPKMMLFDEPTSALDPELRHEVLKVMQDLAEEGMTMVIVTHEIGFAEKVASRLIFIDKGRIAEDGDPQVLIKNPPSQRLQEFCSTSLNFSASLSPKGRHTRFLSFKIAPPPASILIFCSVFSLEESCGGSCSSSSACWAHLPTRYPYPALQPQRQRTQRLNRPRNRISNKKKRPMAHWRMCWIMTPRVKS